MKCSCSRVCVRVCSGGDVDENFAVKFTRTVFKSHSLCDVKVHVLGHAWLDL